MYVSVLFRQVPDVRVLVQALDQDLADQGPQAEMQFIRARVLMAGGQPAAAAAMLRRSIDLDHSFIVPRLDLAEMLIDLARYQEAAALLAEADQKPARLTMLRARILAESNRTVEAIDLLAEALHQHPAHEQLAVQKAELHRRLGQVQKAERQLLELVGARPVAERAYEALIDLYLFDKPTNWRWRYTQLCKRLSRQVPHSRVERRERARSLLAQEHLDHDRAEKMLRELVDEDDDDLRSLRLLMAILFDRDGVDEIESLLATRLVGTVDRPLKRLVQEFYLNQAARMIVKGQFEDAVQVVDRALDKPLEDPSRLLLLQRRALLEAKTPDQIEPRLREAIRRFPPFEADLLLNWAMTLEQMGDSDRAEQIMLEVLAKHPDHAATNNSLGYTWAAHDRHLARAEEMIRTALASDPMNPAYLDSLGWVYYKLGRFDQAVEQLSKATMQPGGRDPVILDHLADALYQLQREQEARRLWADALKAITPEILQRDPEIKTLPQRVKVKLEALSTRQPVPVASSPGTD